MWGAMSGEFFAEKNIEIQIATLEQIKRTSAMLTEMRGPAFYFEQRYGRGCDQS
jgi:hypothetical protein